MSRRQKKRKSAREIAYSTPGPLAEGVSFGVGDLGREELRKALGEYMRKHFDFKPLISEEQVEELIDYVFGKECDRVIVIAPDDFLEKNAL